MKIQIKWPRLVLFLLGGVAVFQIFGGPWEVVLYMTIIEYFGSK